MAYSKVWFGFGLETGVGEVSALRRHERRPA